MVFLWHVRIDLTPKVLVLVIVFFLSMFSPHGDTRDSIYLGGLDGSNCSVLIMQAGSQVNFAKVLGHTFSLHSALGCLDRTAISN